MSEDINDDRREFKRYAIDYEVEIHGLSLEGVPFCEQARLIDISCEGARLITVFPEYYRHGQELTVKIKLPNTDQMEAYILCNASVAWAQSPEAIEDGDESVSIGIHLGEQRTFESCKKPPATTPENGPEGSS
ncbi:MAG: hypothetical protein AUJ58_01650 [Zetaproteobacteria bacterium CG1_02_55_237]|nr:MAG: hypothetical protein AUJ58_01650 [Zetaproteobacteria bacterium CG1_02_55_237]